MRRSGKQVFEPAVISLKIFGGMIRLCVQCVHGKTFAVCSGELLFEVVWDAAMTALPMACDAPAQ